MKEKEIESEILEYLNSLGGFVLKIHTSGRPFQTSSGHIVMLPWKNKFCRNGMSDIFYIHGGRFYCFEVKNPNAHKFIVKHYERLKEGNFSPDNKDHKRWHEQILFIENVNFSGGYGGFVSSINDVKELLTNPLN